MKIFIYLLLIFSFAVNAQRIKVDQIIYEDETDIELSISGQGRDFFIISPVQYKNINTSETWYKIEDEPLRLYKVYFLKCYKTHTIYQMRMWVTKTSRVITIEKNDLSYRSYLKTNYIHKGNFSELV